MKIAIIGGGISGLATAWFLKKDLPQCEITLFEKSSRLGGTIRTENKSGSLIEYGPNGFLNSRQEIVSLCRELGFEKTMIPADSSASNRYIQRNGKIINIPTSPGSFFSTSLISFSSKLKVFAEYLKKNPPKNEESIHEFAVRHFGEEIADFVFNPAMTGIYGSDTSILSLPACFPLLAKIEQEYGSLIKGMIREKKKKKKEGQVSSGPGKLTTFSGGMQELVDVLSLKLSELISIRYETEMIAVSANKEKSTLTYKYKEQELSEDFDYCISACPSYGVQSFLKESFPVVSAACAKIDYTSILVTSCLLENPADCAKIDGFGYLVPAKEKSPILGALFSSCIFPHRQEGNQKLIRVLAGGTHHPEILNLAKEEIHNLINLQLKNTLRLKNDCNILESTALKQAIPIYQKGHLELVKTIEEELKDTKLLVMGNAFYGVSLNDCVVSAMNSAKTIIETLNS